MVVTGAESQTGFWIRLVLGGEIRAASNGNTEFWYFERHWLPAVVRSCTFTLKVCCFLMPASGSIYACEELNMPCVQFFEKGVEAIRAYYQRFVAAEV
ncbi:hypothetical protein CEXT_278281 [Caerostris extrusa]|uniref:Uncharacterized protein n=1 Tax=Caerostris extrusa TaxID=172846 RepID=A0AAV4Y490_CAEEX|nr:hypothetical protein CEXT_278281 [Caerostris extrusa]